MTSGNKQGKWTIPINWKNRRDKELNEVKTIYNEIQRREDLINEYYIKNAILKGEKTSKDLENFRQERRMYYKKDLNTEIIVFKENIEKSDYHPSGRKLPIIKSDDIKELAIKSDGTLDIKGLEPHVEIFDHELLNPDIDNDQRDFDKLIAKIIRSQDERIKYTGFARDLEKEFNKTAGISNDVKFSISSPVHIGLTSKHTQSTLLPSLMKNNEIMYPEDIIAEHSHSLKNNIFNQTQKYQKSSKNKDIASTNKINKKSAKINLSSLDKIAFDKMALREEKISKRKMMKFVENTENMNKKIIKLRKKKKEDKDYVQLKNMIKNIRKDDVNDIYKRQKWVQEQKSKIAVKEEIKEAMNFQPSANQIHNNNDILYLKNIGRTLTKIQSQQAIAGIMTKSPGNGNGLNSNHNQISGNHNNLSNNNDNQIVFHHNLEVNKSIKGIPSLKKMVTMTKNYADFPKTSKIQHVKIETAENSAREFLDEVERIREIADMKYQVSKPLLDKINRRQGSRTRSRKILRPTKINKFRSKSNLRLQKNDNKIMPFKNQVMSQTIDKSQNASHTQFDKYINQTVENSKSKMLGISLSLGQM